MHGPGVRYHRISRLLALVTTMTLAACGGGGGGGSGGGGDNGNSGPPPQSLSGIVMLGPMNGAEVQILSSYGILASGTTDADGRFGPISFNGAYSGPLRIHVQGSAATHWTCDVYAGCETGSQTVGFGQPVPFAGTLDAVLPAPPASRFVTVSLLSNLVAKRADMSGALSAGGVTAAQAEITGMLRDGLGVALVETGVSLPDDFTTLTLFDLANLPAPGSSDDATSLVLSFLNAALMGLAESGQSPNEFVDSFSGQFAALDALPVASGMAQAPSLDTIARAFLTQLQGVSTDAMPAVDALLEPATHAQLQNAVAAQLATLPSLVAASTDLEASIQRSQLDATTSWDIPLTASDAASLAVGDVTVRIQPYRASVTASYDSIFLTAMPVMLNGKLHLHVELLNDVLAALVNGRHRQLVEIWSAPGDYARAIVGVSVDIALEGYGPAVFAGDDLTAVETSTLELAGHAYGPGNPVGFQWNQIAGPVVSMARANTPTPEITLPDVAATGIVRVQLTVTFDSGEKLKDIVEITINPFQYFLDAGLMDPVLHVCLENGVAEGGPSDSTAVSALSCSGVSDATGLDAFSSLTRLELPNNRLADLGPLLAMQELQFADLRGNPGLLCDQVKELSDRLFGREGLLVDDTCRKSIHIELGGEAVDAVLGRDETYLYASVYERDDIAVVSLPEARLVQRISLPGTPRGMDLSIDGTRLFVALFENNAVAVVDLASGDVSTIDLGSANNYPGINDVIEAEPGRLLVTTDTYGSAVGHVAQVLLDSDNTVSRVASDKRIDGDPTLLRAPGMPYAYISDQGYLSSTLYKLDLSAADAPVILQSTASQNHAGGERLSISPDGSRIHLASGQIVDTNTFDVIGWIEPNPSFVSPRDGALYIPQDDSILYKYQFDNLRRLDTIPSGCARGFWQGASRIFGYDDDTSFALITRTVGADTDVVCLSVIAPPSQPLDPYGALRMSDLAFENCVIDAYVANGAGAIGNLRALDCSNRPDSIRSIEGIDQLNNLETLDLSNSLVIDLAPAAQLGALQSVVARNTPVADIEMLLTADNLQTLDLIGSPYVLCNDLDRLAAAGVAVQADACTKATELPLGGAGQAIAIDELHKQVFVSAPDAQAVMAVDFGSAAVTRTYAMPARPYGLSFSADGRTLYVALNGLGDVGVLDTVTGALETIDASAALGDDRTWDVAEISLGRVLVTTGPGSNGSGYVAEIRRDLGNRVTRVADGTLIRSSPVIEVAPDRAAVYVLTAGSPNSLYKLDATQELLPVILEDQHGSLESSRNFSVAPDGQKLYMGSGQVLRSADFSQVYRYPTLYTASLRADGSSLLSLARDIDYYIVEFDTLTRTYTNKWPWVCNGYSPTVVEAYPNGVIGLDRFASCVMHRVAY